MILCNGRGGTQRKTGPPGAILVKVLQICYLWPPVTTNSMSDNVGYEVHTEERGSHWIGWITRGGATKPERSVILIAATREEAEARARRWAEQAQA